MSTIEIRTRDGNGVVLRRDECTTLERADLRHAVIGGGDLSGASLSGADLTGAYLGRSDLRNADLSHANLTGASLIGADLSGARLRFANLTCAYAPEVGLRGADLSFANLHGCYLSDADLTGAMVGFTIFARCVGLDEAIGLATVRHLAPSSLDPWTLAAGLDRLPAEFLRGMGYPPDPSDQLRRMRGGSPHRLPGCLVITDPADCDAAARFRAGLLDRGLCAWEYPSKSAADDFFETVLADLSYRRLETIYVLCSREALRGAAFLRDVASVLSAAGHRHGPRVIAIDLDGSLRTGEAHDTPSDPSTIRALRALCGGTSEAGAALST